jgi:hypothetical protein
MLGTRKDYKNITRLFLTKVVASPKKNTPVGPENSKNFAEVYRRVFLYRYLEVFP